MDKFMLYMLTAGKKAIADGGITVEVMREIDKSRCGILIGSAMGDMKGWMGSNYSISTACATSDFCILNAANHIIRGEDDMMLCGGSDAAIIPIGKMINLTAASFIERNCDGFVVGEGAGVLLLEDLEHAKKRGANIYAEFLGGSFTCDAYHMTEPHPEGVVSYLCASDNIQIQLHLTSESYSIYVEKWHSRLAPVNGSTAHAPENFKKGGVYAN
ncbi:fatty acid biosynthesis 1 [Actinidia rufa]|uniref:beta-ketoacyl-[acyl-carrier-protein] synthase I n=1 Tax=Actinidia rufa TaxID=165716 RepID=A0A7J0ENZ6_9ERIC|nr:fatty acid biosynthesis 1 [Actinidia rufa]